MPDHANDPSDANMAPTGKGAPSQPEKPAQAGPYGPAPAPEQPAVRMVECIKLGRKMEGLPKPPIKGELGQRVYETVSKQAWRMWLDHSKMLINEFRLDLMSEQGQRIWMVELEKYFYGEGSARPPEYMAPEKPDKKE